MQKSGFFNAQMINETYDRLYDATDFSELFKGLVSDGIVIDGNVEDVVDEDGNIDKFRVLDLCVMSVTNTIIIKKGIAIVRGYWYRSDEDIVLIDEIIPDKKYNIVLHLNMSNREIVVETRDWNGTDIIEPEGSDTDYVLPLATVTINSNGSISITDRRIFIINNMKILSKINEELIQQINELSQTVNVNENRILNLEQRLNDGFKIIQLGTQNIRYNENKIVINVQDNENLLNGKVCYVALDFSVQEKQNTNGNKMLSIEVDFLNSSQTDKRIIGSIIDAKNTDVTRIFSVNASFISDVGINVRYLSIKINDSNFKFLDSLGNVSVGCLIACI